MGSIQLTNDYILLNSEHIHLKTDMWTSLAVQGLRPQASTSEGTSLIPRD